MRIEKSTAIIALMIAATMTFAGRVQITDEDTSEVAPVTSNGLGVAVNAEPTIAQVPFLHAVSFGDVSGYSVINKFGHNPTAGTGDGIWSGDGAYAFYPTNAQSLSVVSSSAADDTSSNGAHTVTFYGLDSSWNEANETVTMDGTTPVALTNTYRRMFRGIVNTIGGAESNVGNISVTNAAGTVAAYIAATDGQTQMAMYTVPAGKSALFLKGYVGLKNDTFQGESGNFKWQLKLNNGTAGAWQTKGQIGLVNIGSSWWQYEYGAPSGMIPAKTDIRIIQSSATDTMDSVAGYDLLLKDD